VSERRSPADHAKPEIEAAAVGRLVEFGRALRIEGLSVDTRRMVEFCRCAGELPPGDLYWAGRATLVSRREEIKVYDRIFDAFFAGRLEIVEVPPLPELRLTVEQGQDSFDVDERPNASAGSHVPSRLELLRPKVFDPVSAQEEVQLGQLVEELRRDPPHRVARRRHPADRGETDLRRTFRHASRTGGEPLAVQRRSRALRPRRLVLAVDVSGSMATYSRAPLLFGHSALRAGLPWTAYCFGTRVTEVTGCLRARAPEVALAAVADEVADFDGGTRIADGLARMLGAGSMRPGARIRGALVIVVSDGLEIGDPAELGRRMEDLRRLAHRVIWLNPLKSTPGYAPIAGGMAAALPSVDYFASADSLEAFMALVPELRRLAA